MGTPLQTTFVKVIRDPSRAVRSDASEAIIELMAHSNKFDNLLKELNNFLKKKQNENENADADVTISILQTMFRVLRLIGPSRIKSSILDDICSTFCVSDVYRSERDDSLRFVAAPCVAAIIHCFANESEQCDAMIVALLDIDDDDDDWRSIEYDLNSLAFLVADPTVYRQSVHEAYSDDIEQTFLNFLTSQTLLLQIAALRIGYNFVARLANFEFLSNEERKKQIICLLDRHLLPLLSAKVNKNNQDIVISSCEFLLDGLSFNDNDEEKSESVWRDGELHQVIIPYLITNHLNNIQPELMRKCVTTLLQINENSTGFCDEFFKNCNQKIIVKELKTIIDALSRMANK